MILYPLSCVFSQDQVKPWSAFVGINYANGFTPVGKGSLNSAGISENESPKLGWSLFAQRELLIHRKVLFEPGIGFSKLGFTKSFVYPEGYTFWPRLTEQEFDYQFLSIRSRIRFRLLHFNGIAISQFVSLTLNTIVHSQVRQKNEQVSSTFFNYRETTSFEKNNLSYDCGLQVEWRRVNYSLSYLHFLADQYSATPPARRLHGVRLEVGYNF